MDRTDTAHRAWDTNWQTEAGRAGWTAPEADVAEWAGIARQRGAKVALDLGCGVGRHALMLAGLGFETHALDGSAAGIAHMQGEAAERGLAIIAREGMMTELPYADGSFDYVLSFNVIYHGDHAIVAKAIAEIQRVLRPGGLYQGTMLSNRDTSRLKGREISPGTFVAEAADDKVHPHFYCSAGELVALFDGFELLSLLDKEHTRPGSWHWHLVAERR